MSFLRPLGQIGLGLIIGGIGLITLNPSLVRFGAGIVAGGIRRALTKTDGPGLAAAQGAILRNRLNPKAPVPLVYGSAKLGVILADIAVDGGSTNNEDLYVPTVICHGSRDDLGIASIDKIFFNNQLAINAVEALQSPYTSSNLAFAKYLGTSTQDVADLTIGGTDLDTVFTEWDKSTDDGKGLAGVLFMLTWDRDVYPSSVPTFTMEVKGNFVEDTRSEVSGVNITFADADPDTITRASGSFVTDGYVAGDRVDVSGSSSNDGKYTIDTVAATVLTLVAGDVLAAEGPSGGITLKRWAHPDNGGDNPAMVLRDYLLSTTYGAGVASSLIDTSSFETMANYCDESVSNPAGSVNRFTANGWLSTGSTVRQNIEAILSSMRASLIYQGGTFHLFIPRVVSASSITLNTDNILGDWDFTLPGADSKINLVRMTYIDPDKEFQADVVQWPEPGATNPYLTADNSAAQERSLDLPLTQNVYTAQQIGMTLLKESRQGIVVGVTVNETALQLEVGDVLAVTHDTPGWTSKLFWVAAWTMLPDTNVRLTLVEYETSVTDNMTFADADPDTITRASGSWITDGFVAGDEVDVSGSASNDGTYIVASVAASVLTLHAAETLAAEGPVSCTVKTSVYGVDTQSTATADVADNLPRNPNNIADPTGLTLTATELEGFYTATGQYVARIQVTLTDADDAFVDGYDVEARRTDEPTAGTNFDNYGFMVFGAAEFFVFPVNEGISWTVRVRSRNNATGVTGAWVSAAVVPAYPAAAGTTAITDGWSSAQNTAAPENGDEVIDGIGDVAYSNLEDANEIGTAYTIYYDIDARAMPGGTCTLTLYKNDGPASTTWTQVDSAVHTNADNLSDQTLSYTGSMGTDFDFRVVLTYDFTPSIPELASVTMHGEDHGTQPGVQYNKITTGSIGGTLPASSITSGGALIDGAVAQSNVTQHEAAVDHDALTNFVSGEHFLQSAITAVGTLAAGAVPASLVTAGTFGAGDYLMDSKLFVGGTSNANMAIGITIDQLTNGDQILSLKSSGRVNTGLTTVTAENVEVTDYVTLSKVNSNQGGLRLQGLMENGATGSVFQMLAYGGTANTAKSTAAQGLFAFTAFAHNGSNALANVGADGNIFAIRGQIGGTSKTIWLADVNGASWQDGNLMPFTDNAQDIGSGANSWKDLYLDGTAIIGGLLQTVATASGSAGLNLPHGTAPTSPVDGDRWTTTAAAFDRINGVTKEVAHVGDVAPDTVTTMADDATPSISAGNLFKTGGTTAITDFDDGVVGQTIKILAAHSVTITDGAPIILSGGANFDMVATDTLELTMFDDQVWQEVSRSVN